MSTSGFDAGRFGRLLGLIAFVSAVFVITSAEALEGDIFRLSVFAIGAVAIGTAMIGFLIAAGAAWEQPREEPLGSEEPDNPDESVESNDSAESIESDDSTETA
jgi:hypothetical protein